jgi:hypothetical protein
VQVGVAVERRVDLLGDEELLDGGRGDVLEPVAVMGGVQR